MGYSIAELNIMKSMIGFNGARVRKGKYLAHRNRYCLFKTANNSNPILDGLHERKFVSRVDTDEHIWYSITKDGLNLLGEYLGCEIEIMR